MDRKPCAFWIVFVLVVATFLQGARAGAAMAQGESILVSNADLTFVPVVVLDARFADETGSQLVEIHARMDRRKKQTRSFKLVVDGAIFRLGGNVREMESVYGPVDLASLRMFRVRGEFSDRRKPVRYRIEFGFREQYQDFVYALPFQYALPQCFMEISDKHLKRLGCHEYGTDGRITTRLFAFK